MGKIAFVFPGQGAQYVGMGKDFYENCEEAKEIFELASKATGLDVPALCFEENDQINITEYTQIAMLADEVAILKAAEKAGLKCDVTAGLSLGEYGAVVAAGILSPEDAFKVIRQRGIFMQEAYPVGGGMSAVIGADAQLIEEICEKTAQEMNKPVSIANYNCPGQIVITGDIDAVTEAGKKLMEAGAKLVKALTVSGPFHSSLLTGAGEKLSGVLDEVTISDMKVPYLANLTGDFVKSSSETKELLVKQVSGSVRWQQCVEAMMADGVDTLIEMGPGKTLVGFMKRIDKEKKVKCFNIDKYEDLEKVLAEIN